MRVQDVYSQMLNDLRAGKYRDGERLPSDRGIANTFGISTPSAGKVRLMLAAAGWTRTGPGGDTVINLNENEPS